MSLEERVAILLWERMAGMEYTVHGWESMSPEFQEEWREHARAVVEAVSEPERVTWPSPGWRRPMADPDTEYLERLLEAHEVERPVMGCESCAQEAEELRVVGPDHRNTADYASGDPHCPECDAVWPPVRRPVMGEFDPTAVSPEGQAPDPVLWERARLAQQAEYEAMDSFPVLEGEYEPKKPAGPIDVRLTLTRDGENVRAKVEWPPTLHWSELVRRVMGEQH